MNEKNHPSESDAADRELELIEAARKLNANVDTGGDSLATNRQESTLDIAALELSPGTQIGHYKLLEKSVTEDLASSMLLNRKSLFAVRWP